MYKVLVVDDEPTGIRHICRILNKYCPQFEIVGTVENGLEALNTMTACKPDVVITDVCMPVVDGIQLAKRIRKEYAEVFIIIVSGFSEFEYAKQAIVANVSDYLLKPLLPQDLIETLNAIKIKLDKLYYEKQYSIIRKMYGGVVDKTQLKTLFQHKNYLCILSKAIGTMKYSRDYEDSCAILEENGYCFSGRDETETLYIVPADGKTAKIDRCISMVKSQNQTEDGYSTIVYYEEQFDIEQLPHILQKLFKKIEEVSIVGSSQICSASAAVSNKMSSLEASLISHIEVKIINRDTEGIVDGMEHLLESFGQNHIPMIIIESSMRHLLYMIYNSCGLKTSYADIDDMMEDGFHTATNYRQLQENILSIVKQCFYEKEVKKEDNRKVLFDQIQDYICIHLKEAITVNDICKRFGVSQATLSRMFRNFGKTTFSSYITSERIREAKRLMAQDHTIRIKDIAEKVGYNDPFYFSRIFRLIEGCSPTEYMDTLCHCTEYE